MLSTAERSVQALSLRTAYPTLSHPVDMEVAEQVRTARTRMKMSQRDLAKRLKVAPSAVAQWETGVTLPSIGRRVDLSRLLDIPFGSLIPEANLTGEGPLRDPQIAAIVEQLLKLPLPVREAVLMQVVATAEALENQATDTQKQ